MLLTSFEISRLALLYAHLILFALAIAQVIGADWRIAVGTFTREDLRRTAHTTALLLGGLWFTGLALIFLDTGFDPAVLATKPKLLLKVLCVSVLTINGAVLHYVAFPVLVGTGPLTAKEAILLAATGSLSSSHWLMAAFIGLAKPLGRLSTDVLVSGYLVVCIATLLLSLLCSPVLRRRLNDWRLAGDLMRVSSLRRDYLAGDQWISCRSPFH